MAEKNKYEVTRRIVGRGTLDSPAVLMYDWRCRLCTESGRAFDYQANARGQARQHCVDAHGGWN